MVLVGWVDSDGLVWDRVIISEAEKADKGQMMKDLVHHSFR